MDTKKVIWRANQVISIETKRKDENRKENVDPQKDLVFNRPIDF